MKTNSIHAGSLVRVELYRQNHSVAWLADNLGIKRPNCYRILYVQSLHTANLERLSIVMQHDFFADYTQELHVTQNITDCV